MAGLDDLVELSVPRPSASSGWGTVWRKPLILSLSKDGGRTGCWITFSA